MYLCQNFSTRKGKFHITATFNLSTGFAQQMNDGEIGPLVNPVTLDDPYVKPDSAYSPSPNVNQSPVAAALDWASNKETNAAIVNHIAIAASSTKKSRGKTRRTPMHMMNPQDAMSDKERASILKAIKCHGQRERKKSEESKMQAEISELKILKQQQQMRINQLEEENKQKQTKINDLLTIISQNPQQVQTFYILSQPQ